MQLVDSARAFIVAHPYIVLAYFVTFVTSLAVRTLHAAKFEAFEKEHPVVGGALHVAFGFLSNADQVRRGAVLILGALGVKLPDPKADDPDEPPTAGAVNTSRLLLAGATAMLALSLTTGCGSMRFAPPVSAGGVPGAAIEVSTPERCSQLDDRHTTYGIVAAGAGAGAGVTGLAAGLSANGRLGLGIAALAVGIVSAATAKGAQDTAATFVREGCGSMAAQPAKASR